MSDKMEITAIEEIQFLVNTFYTSIRNDDLIGPIFNRIVGDHWPTHLAKMYNFWETVLLSKHSYFGSPFPPHAKLGLSAAHFERWLDLWKQTLDQHFHGEKAEEAKWRGDKMAEMFLAKIDYHNSRNSDPLI